MMAVMRRTLLAVLLGILEASSLAVQGHQGRHVHMIPGAPSNVSLNDRRLHQVVLTTAYTYNNQSNDAFLFRPSSVHRAQRQIVKGLRYIIDLDVSRTVCRKRVPIPDLSQCEFQPEGRLHQTFRCHTEVWFIPWTNQTTMQVFYCKDTESDVYSHK
uniref:Cystatin domain-containing protein n=2 Tax=Sphaeramia orbicularis TaxID=375764 RepID=A0A673C0D2_9TELE